MNHFNLQHYLKKILLIICPQVHYSVTLDFKGVFSYLFSNKRLICKIWNFMAVMIILWFSGLWHSHIRYVAFSPRKTSIFLWPMKDGLAPTTLTTFTISLVCAGWFMVDRPDIHWGQGQRAPLTCPFLRDAALSSITLGHRCSNLTIWSGKMASPCAGHRNLLFTPWMKGKGPFKGNS